MYKFNKIIETIKSFTLIITVTSMVTWDENHPDNINVDRFKSIPPNAHHDTFESGQR